MFKNLFLVIVIAVLMFGVSRLSWAMMCGGHEGHKQIAQAGHGEHHEATQAAVQPLAEGAVDVGNKICPVSGEKIDEKMKVAYEYEGKVYNFCCASCVDEFKKDPQKYIKKVEEELQAEPKEDAGRGEQGAAVMQEPEVMGQEMHQGHHRQ